MLIIDIISAGKQDLSRLVGIGSNRQDALENLKIAWKVSVEIAEVNRLSCGVMKVGVSVIVVMLGWNLDDILLIFSIKNSEKVDGNGRIEFWNIGY